MGSLLLVLVLATPTTGWAPGPRAAPVASLGATMRTDGGHLSGPTPYVSSTVYYDSSIDGFNLSYTEAVPANYSPVRSYPLAIELHGLAGTEVTPMPGGWPTVVNNTTVQAAMDAGFLLILPNTRTGDGWYTDSAYTGPQQQDIFDAIVHEEQIRSVGALYLYGFSMGGIGSLAIGLSHPGMFAGLGAVAMFSDMYQMLAYFNANGLGGVTDAFLRPVNGESPANSSLAQSFTTRLSALRFAAHNASGTRLYFTDGAEDILSTNNASQWPYQQGNDSVLRASCNVIVPLREPANCTQPIAAISAVDPANFTYRYIFEAEGAHAYAQLNATDLFAFFNGQRPSGTFWGGFPNPTPVAPPRPLLTLANDPYACGNITYDGRAVVPGSVDSSVGVHTLAFTNCTGERLSGVRTSGAVSYDVADGTLNVSGSGSAVGVFVPPLFTVTVQTDAPCAIELDGQFVSNGSTLSRAAGSYPIAVPACSSYSFGSWSTTGGLSVGTTSAATTTLTVSGNGTLAATFTGGPPPPTPSVTVHVSPPACGPLIINGSRINDGTVISLANGAYPLQALACPGYTFDSWATTGGVSVTVPPMVADLVVVSDGALTAVYAAGGPPVFTIALHVVPSNCSSAISIDGISYSDGMSAFLPAGSYVLAAAACAAGPFHGWTFSGGVAVGGTALDVVSNGSLTASYVNRSTGAPVGTNDSGSFPLIDLLPVFVVAAVLVLAGAIWMGRRAAERRRHLPDSETEGRSGPEGH